MLNVSKNQDKIIECQDVTVEADERYSLGLREFSFCLCQGEVAVVRVPRAGVAIPLADLCSGMTSPDSGSVRFLGRSWTQRPHSLAARDRARIGRVHGQTAWVSNLDVDENILLPQWYHTHRSISDIRAEAESLAQQFGLDALPQTRPAWTSDEILCKAQWIRALIGPPELLILEHPEAKNHESDRVALIAAIEQARVQGTAVVWITSKTAPSFSNQTGGVHAYPWEDSFNEGHSPTLTKDKVHE